MDIKNFFKKGLNFNDEDDEYLDSDEEYSEEPAPKKKNSDDEKGSKSAKGFAKKKTLSNVSYQIEVIKPKNMEDSQQIADSLIDGVAVLLNLTMVDIDLARRVLDFALGATYAVNGTYKKVTDTIFVFVPCGVDISSELTESEEAQNK